MRFVLCSLHKAAKPRTEIWGQPANEDRGRCPLSGKAQHPAYSARCSWECLIITSGSVTLARGRTVSLALWRLLTSVLGWAFKHVHCGSWHSHFKGLSEALFCCLFFLSFSYLASLKCLFQGTFRNPGWLTVQHWHWANSLLLRKLLGHDTLRKETFSLMLLHSEPSLSIISRRGIARMAWMWVLVCAGKL